MRTTLELDEEIRPRLLELAARRGEKGFSRIVQEAVAAYLESRQDWDRAKKKALELGGSLSEEEAEELEARVRKIRETGWSE